MLMSQYEKLGKLLKYFEKDERMKDMAVLLAEEERKINELIA